MTFKKGDLVMVVRPSTCCGSVKNVGSIREIGDQLPFALISVCMYCGDEGPTYGQVRLSNGNHIEKYRLIKINPPADDTEEVADKELEIVK